MNPHKEQAEALHQAGKRDLLTLQLLIETGRAPHESIGFHAQQACEKFLKFRYEGCPIEMVKDANSLVSANTLADWANALLQAPPEH